MSALEDHVKYTEGWREATEESAKLCEAKADYCKKKSAERYKPGSNEAQMMEQLQGILRDTAARIRQIVPKTGKAA